MSLTRLRVNPPPEVVVLRHPTSDFETSLLFVSVRIKHVNNLPGVYGGK